MAEPPFYRGPLSSHSENPSVIHPGPPSGTKRKREGPQKFYSVRVGRQPGIYHTWPECLSQVEKFPKAVFKRFNTLSEAQNFLNGSGGTGKWYGVRSGRVPGVYTDWQDVLDQVRGWKGVRYMAFKSREEAERWVAMTESGEDAGAGTPTAAAAAAAAAESGPAAKKAKTVKGVRKGLKEEGSLSPGVSGEYEAGEGPLLEDAEDGFDATIVLDPRTTVARYRSRAEREKFVKQAVRPVEHAPIRIYTDGSSLGNGRTGAAAGVGVYFGPGDGRNLSEPLGGTKQTNQRAELTAIVRALELAPRDRRVVIVTDSQYSINCVTVWFTTWRQNGWLNSHRKPVENRDLVQKILDLLEERFRLNKHRMSLQDRESSVLDKNSHWNRGPGGVAFEWVKGHDKDESNIAADRLAVAGSQMAQELTAADDLNDE